MDHKLSREADWRKTGRLSFLWKWNWMFPFSNLMLDQIGKTVTVLNSFKFKNCHGSYLPSCMSRVLRCNSVQLLIDNKNAIMYCIHFKPFGVRLGCLIPHVYLTHNYKHASSWLVQLPCWFHWGHLLRMGSESMFTLHFLFSCLFNYPLLEFCSKERFLWLNSIFFHTGLLW